MIEEESVDSLKRAKALDKIKKCFALGKSNNPYEAEAAMRQARKLMGKFKLEMEDICSSEAEEFSIRIGNAKSIPVQWIRMLSATVGKAFGCVTFFAHGRTGQSLIFVGEIGSAEMSAYAFEVLERQLTESRRDYLSENGLADRAAKRKARVMYSEAWIAIVDKRVEEFAGVSDDAERAITAYTTKHYPGVGKVKLKRRKVNEEEFKAYLQGIEDGNNVSLHKPMRKDDLETVLIENLERV